MTYLVQPFDTDHRPLDLRLGSDYAAPDVQWPHATGRNVAVGCAAIVDGDERTVLVFLHGHTSGTRADGKTRRVAYWLVQVIGRQGGTLYRGRWQIYLTRYGKSCTAATARIPFGSRQPPILLPDPAAEHRCPPDCRCLRHYPSRQNRKDTAA